jgi:hypothetical protein
MVDGGVEIVDSAEADFSYVPSDPGLPTPVLILRERARGLVAALLLALLSVVIILLLSFVAAEFIVIADARTLFELAVTPLIGLVGTVVGFYFGTATE